MNASVAQVQASLAGAQDMKLARVVAMVDALPDRGEADALIAPLRPRLAVIRPARPPGFTRVLFTPLDVVIMSPAEWRRCGVGVPRPALKPLSAALRRMLPGFSDGVDGAFAGSAPALWHAAAAKLDALATPAGWEAAGLPVTGFASVKAAAAAVLHEAAAIEALSDARAAADDGSIWAVLARSKDRGAVALDTVAFVLLARLPSPDQVVLALARPGNEGVTGRVIGHLARVVAAGDAADRDMRDAAKEAARVAVLLTAMETGASPVRRARLDAIRRDADRQSRRSFSLAVTRLEALADTAIVGTLDGEAMAALETSARDLRRLAAAARAIGSGEHYDSALMRIAESLGGDRRGLGVADRVRLIEILAGPERALALLAAMQRGETLTA